MSKFQKAAANHDIPKDSKLGQRLTQLIDSCTLQKVESAKNSFKLYQKSYDSLKDTYSLYSMAFMEDNGLGTKVDKQSALRKYSMVFKDGFKKLMGSRKFVDGEYKREGFAEILSASSGLIKIYFNRLISCLF